MRVKLRHSRINKNGKDLSLVDLLYRTNSRESCQLKQNRGVYSSAEDRSTELQGAWWPRGRESDGVCVWFGLYGLKDKCRTQQL